MVKNEVGIGCGVFCLGRAAVYVGSSTGVSIVFQVNFPLLSGVKATNQHCYREALALSSSTV